MAVTSCREGSLDGQSPWVVWCFSLKEGSTAKPRPMFRGEGPTRVWPWGASGNPSGLPVSVRDLAAGSRDTSPEHFCVCLGFHGGAPEAPPPQQHFGAVLWKDSRPAVKGSLIISDGRVRILVSSQGTHWL